MAEVTTFEVDGRAVACIDAGAGAGVPLLLLHDITGSKEDFGEVVEALGGRRRVVALDLPGHGGSTGTGDPADSSLAALADWVLRAADALGLGDVHLLGHSFGGLLAQRVASTASQRLRSLILAGTGLGAPGETTVERLTRIALAARDQGMAAAWTESQRIDRERGLPADDPPRVELVRERFVALDPDALVGETQALITALPLGAFLRGIDVPVLVLHGERDDAWLPSEQRLLARTVTGARYAVIPAAGHLPQQDNRSAWLEVVEPFLAAAEKEAALSP